MLGFEGCTPDNLKEMLVSKAIRMLVSSLYHISYLQKESDLIYHYYS